MDINYILLRDQPPARKILYMLTCKHGVAAACHDLQFSQPWKCSSAVSSAANFTLPDGALRVQEHAAWSAFNYSPCFWKHVFSRLQSGES